MTPEEVAAIGESVAEIVRAYGAKHVAPLAAENAVLRGRLDILQAKLEAMPVPKDGKNGRDGVDGTNGRDGIDGKAGEAGLDGKDGTDGIDGKDGAPGLAGKDGTNGINGKDGSAGIDGKDGRNGIDGKDGSSVDPLIVRAMVLDAVQAVIKEIPAPKDGRDGRDGRDGADGSNGSSGRDGSAIDYIDLDASKSYPRGTHALCRGGILYAERTTDAINGGDYKAAGWRQLVGGLADVQMSLLSDGRTFELAFEYSDGRKEKRQAKADIPAHRGVWRDAITYDKADVVQWSGNAWIAREVTTDKPGDSKSWDLLARRGRDGKAEA